MACGVCVCVCLCFCLYMIIIVACGHTALAEFQWCLIYERVLFNKAHETYTHTISTPIVSANNSTKRKRKKQRETATMREPISSGIKKYVYVEYVFCLIPYTEPVRQPKIYTRDFLSIALNGIICCSKIGFQRPKEEKQKRTAQNEMRHTQSL